MVKVSDSGGPAARFGFKYQDHASAQFVIEMLSGGIIQIECETSDDIQVVREEQGLITNEFIQVKTTEGDGKWSVKELCDKGASKNSIFTNSLKLDDSSSRAIFRIITKRDVAKNLSCLTTPFEERQDHESRDTLAKSIQRASKKFESPNNNDAFYWVDNTLWEVPGSQGALEALNLQRLSSLAEDYGCTFNHTIVLDIYKQILEKVEVAATASRVHASSKKIIKKAHIQAWWEEKVKEVDSLKVEYTKPYKGVIDEFLVEYHSLTESELKRGITGLEAGYELEQWRCDELAEHLIEYVPEVALKASELASFNNRNFRHLYKEAVERINDKFSADKKRLVSEILLHIAIRQTFHSEPIACKIFYASDQKSKCFANAHIVKNSSTGKDELWLGKATISFLSEYDSVVESIVSSLVEHLDKDFLKKERKAIIELKEARHLMPNNLGEILYKNAPIDTLIEHLCLPILIAYDSPTLSKGFSKEYKENIIHEAIAKYNLIKDSLHTSLTSVKIHIFLLPFDSCDELINKFEAKLN